MYRQHKRMADVVPVCDSADSFHLNFLEHVVQLPAISFAWNVASQTYRNVKSSNKLLDITLNTAEKAGSFVTQRSVPVIKKFENQIRIVDDIACKGLENLVEIAPVITSQPDQVLNYGRRRCNEAIQNNVNKLAISKNYVKSLVDSEIQRVVANVSALLSISPGKRVLQLPDHILDQIETYVNHYYPPPQEEENEGTSGTPGSQPKLPPWTRAKNLAKIVETRVSTKFDQDLQGVKQFTTSVYSNVVNFNLTRSVDEFLTSPFGSLLLNSVDSAFDQAENYVDYYIPPIGDEDVDQPFGDREMLPAWRRADLLSNILKERLYKHALLRLQKIQLQGRETAVWIRNSDVLQFISSVNIFAFPVLSGSSEYASSVVQFVFRFHVTKKSDETEETS